ncbi:DUF5684 domain-containing protein [Microbacterium sp. NPDC089189]|uniref:DUF5684 domain-containing protein n=1 Tax=Microbacterium sp. NPDC089189 TaxID=3154972 RepID=UPI003426288C
MHLYYDDPSGSVAALAAFYLLLIPFILLFAAAGYVLSSWFYMKIFEKAGVQGKWRAWVPVYNSLIFAKLGDLSPWWLLGLIAGNAVLSWVPVLNFLLPIAAWIYLILAAYRVGLKLQKEGAWVVLYIFLSIVWLGIAAFDKSRWNTAVRPAAWAGNFLADKTVWQGIPVQVAGYAAPPAGYAAPQPGAPAPGAYPPPPAGTYPPAPPAGAVPPAPPAGTVPPAPPAAPNDTEPPRV